MKSWGIFCHLFIGILFGVLPPIHWPATWVSSVHRPGEDHATKASGNSQVGAKNSRPFGGNPPRKMVGASKGGFLKTKTR